MSFADNPPKQYVTWKPNESFIKFFEDMKERRVAASDSPSMRVTDSSPPSPGTGRSVSTGGPKSRKRVTQSDIIVSTAESLTGTRYKKAQSAGTGSVKKRKQKSSDISTEEEEEKPKKKKVKKSPSKIEKKIKNHTF